MVNTIIKGILLGITVAFIIGPVFFTLLQTSIYRGFRAGVQLALGVVLSDLLLIVLGYLGVLQLLNDEHNYLFVGTIGGILLITFGVVTILRKPSPEAKNISIDSNANSPIFTYISKGFFMNIMNPFLLVFWVSIVSMQGTVAENKYLDIIIFFSAVLLTIFITDIIKCYIAKWIKQYITYKIVLWLNKLVGLTLMGFGLYLIYKIVFILG
jgi:threonine/homoserine/homoserine lactone efflux protein